MAKTTKSAKSAKSERQLKIDAIRGKQKGADKRRGFAIVGVCILVAVVIIGAAAYVPLKNWWDRRQFADVALADIGAPASTCEKITTQKADGNQDHVPTGQQVTYTTSPPAFGPHWNEFGVAPAPMQRKVYTDDRPELESLVHNLEHGYTIMWYDQTIADDSDAMREIRAIGEKFAGTEDFRDKFVAAPWTSKDGDAFPGGAHVAFSHWSKGGVSETDTSKQVGVFQYCDQPSGAALETFMEKYPYFDSPEPDAQ